MLVMVVEAMAQTAPALHQLEGQPAPRYPCYRLRNATFTKALVLEEGKRQTIMLMLVPRGASYGSWYEFKVLSLVGAAWIEHSEGMIRAEDDPQKSMLIQCSQIMARIAKLTVL